MESPTLRTWSERTGSISSTRIFVGECYGLSNDVSGLPLWEVSITLQGVFATDFGVLVVNVRLLGTDKGITATKNTN